MSTLLTLLILIAIGLIAGFSSGLTGIGGAVIMIPSLVYLLSMNQYEAQGTSLAVMLPPIGILAAYNYYKAGEVNIKYAIVVSAAFIIGGYFGSKIALDIPIEILKKIFGIVLIVIALNFIFGK